MAAWGKSKGVDLTWLGWKEGDPINFAEVGGGGGFDSTGMEWI